MPEEEFDVSNDLKKGSFASDTQNEARKPKSGSKPVESNWKPIYTYILLTLIIAGLVWFGISKFTEHKVDKSMEELDPALKIITDDYYTYNNFEFVYNEKLKL